MHFFFSFHKKEENSRGMVQVKMQSRDDRQQNILRGTPAERNKASANDHVFQRDSKMLLPLTEGAASVLSVMSHRLRKHQRINRDTKVYKW